MSVPRLAGPGLAARRPVYNEPMNPTLRQIRAIALTLIAAAASIATAAAAPAPKSPAANVVLVTIDTLRADYVAAYGSSKAETPVLDSLARDGVLFENAYCQVPMTPPSHASILTGTYPTTHGLRDFTSGRMEPGLPTLATILRQRGYSTAAFVSAFVLDRSWGLDAGFDLYWDDFGEADFEGVNPGNVQRRADQTIDRALEWLPTAKPPFFVWIHLFDPHHDYDPPEPFKTRYRNDPYAGEVAYADQQLGRFLDALRKRGIYSSSLIVAASDHGEGLGAHQEQEHGFFLYEETLRIPLIMKLPSGYSDIQKRIGGVVQSVDILPTALQILRIPTGASDRIEGSGLLSAILGKRRQQGFAYAETTYPRTTFGWSELKAYREGSSKIIEAPRPELYDLAEDPQETRNRFEAESALGNQLLNKLRRFESGLKPSSAAVSTGNDAARLERLSALGYVSLDQPIARGNDEILADPKDKVDVYNRILKGLQAAEAGRLEVSNAILEQVAQADPELFIVHYSLGNNYLKLKQPNKALAALEKARSLNPEFASAAVASARAFGMLKRDGEAIALLEPLAAHPAAPLTARRELAVLYSRNRRFAEAAEIYRKILAERPSDEQATQFLGVTLVEKRDYAAGLETLENAVAMGLDNALIRNFMGIALANLGRREDAVKSYRRAVQLNPNYPLPRLNLSLTLLQMGKKEEALREFEGLCRVAAELCQRYRARFGNVEKPSNR